MDFQTLKKETKMKKIYLMVVAMAFTLSFIACGGKSTSNNTEDTSAPEIETVAPAADSDVLVKYEAIVDRMIKLYEGGKFQTGDAEAIAEYTKITQELTDIAEELQKEVQNLTPEQMARFAELGQKLTDAATKAASSN
jgi:cell division protein FtsB